MEWYVHSVLNRLFSSMYHGAENEFYLDKESKQGAAAASVTTRDWNGRSQPPSTLYDIPDSDQLPNWKGRDTNEAIIIPKKTANFIMGRALSAFVSTRPIADMDGRLIGDDGATSTLTKTLENYTLCKPKVMGIQTAHFATLMSTSHLCLRTCYVRDCLGEIRLIDVKA